MLTGVPFTLQESVYKYKLKIKDGDKVIEEDIEIDTEKQTETYHIPKKYSGNGEEVDIVYDFKQVTTLVKGQSGRWLHLVFIRNTSNEISSLLHDPKNGCVADYEISSN